jgi:hypothetical protein
MPRDYANEANAIKALDREGLNLAIMTLRTLDNGRVMPHFEITEGAPGATELVERLKAEDFSHTILSVITLSGDDDHTGEMAAAGRPAAEPEGGANGDHHTPEPASAGAHSGDESGEDGAAAAAGDETDEPAPERRSQLNTHVSDLFFNYSHDDYQLLTMSDGDDIAERARAAITKDAHEFADSIRYAFGAVVDVEELVFDFFERL